MQHSNLKNFQHVHITAFALSFSQTERRVDISEERGSRFSCLSTVSTAVSFKPEFRFS